MARAELAGLPAVASSPGVTRRFVCGTLEGWGVSHLVADAALVASELSTNAVRHARSTFRVELTRFATAVRIAVYDASTEVPVMRAPSPTDAGGRGLAVVAGLSREWGSTCALDGKVVWAELTA